MDKEAFVDKINSASSPAMIIPIVAAELISAIENISISGGGGASAEPQRNFMAMIENFHKKFDLEYGGEPRSISGGLEKFRIKFMEEELMEYKRACKDKSLEGQLDALVDLVYVALGTAYIQGFDFEEAFARVHAANMKKRRTRNPKASKRGSTYDVIKPEGWKPPDLGDLV